MARDPRTVLVIAVPVMGDVLLSTPLIRSVKKAWPDAAIDVLTRPGGSAVLEGNADVRERIELAKKPSGGQLARFLLSRFRRYDLVLSNSASDRAFIYSLFMGKRRVSLVYELHSNMALKQRFYEHSPVIDYERYHTIVQNLKLIDSLGIDAVHEVTLPHASDADQRIADILGPNWTSRSLALIHPNSAAPYKRWHKQGWHHVVEALKKRGLGVLVTGGPSSEDRAYVESLELDSPGVTLLVGQLRLADISRLLERCRLYVGVDTLITHMAAATGIPTIALFGPANPVTWGPWPKGSKASESPWQKTGTQQIGNVALVQGIRDCVPCGQSGCLRRLDSHSECLDELDATRVDAAVEALMDR